MAQNEDLHVVLAARCLCKAHTFTARVERSSLPLEATCCHCNSCRHATGGLYTCDVAWPGDGAEILNSSLQRYAFSDKLTYRFCGTCSSLMFFQKNNDPSETDGGDVIFEVATGVLDNVDVPGLVQIRHHMFVGDTIDGGASVWMRQPNRDGTPARLWMGQKYDSQELTEPWPSISSLPDASTKPSVSEIPIRCHCKGVDLVLHDGAEYFKGKPQEELPIFVDPVTHKVLGGFDACDSCRLSCAVDIFNWTFTLLRHIKFPAESIEATRFPRTSIELKAAILAKNSGGCDPHLETLEFYESSPDVQRYFCSRCSACVFFAVNGRPELVDLAIGTLESPDGARSEGLISWGFGGKMVWRQDAAGGWREDLVTAVENEAEAWRIGRGYPKNWRRVQREELEKK